MASSSSLLSCIRFPGPTPLERSTRRPLSSTGSPTASHPRFHSTSAPILPRSVSISGHSRGGKVAFALALGHAGKTSLPLAALIAVDPVDGTEMGKQTPPPILTYKLGSSLLVPAPVMVIGTGLGELPRNFLFPPCAPLGVSHAAFYAECAAPACHLVARDYGHTDMMDDVTTGAKGLATRCVCKSGESRAPMRRFVGGAMVAFLKKWVEGRPEWLDGIRERPEVAPVVLSVVEFRDR
ncbi:unnamed protein product [Alopecurus aequalis]